MICILGIMDIVRPEVPDAVKKVQNAGVTVRMITGDLLVTAMAIAEKCNIITKEEIGDEHVCIEGPVLYERVGGLKRKNASGDDDDETSKGVEEVANFKAFREFASRVKVVARARPEDKQVMVVGLRQMGAVVAVTGDGTNDATALKKADVGFAMGRTGTDVCKEAADILITDDNFTSIVLACKWGRNVFDNIQRFLQFQLTVNVVALITTFIGSCITKETPLAAIQLLWVNLIMDSLASLALATELPKESLLDRMPQDRDDYIVSRKMVKHILGMAIYQCIILFVFLFAGEHLIVEPDRRFKWFEYEDSCCVYPGRLEEWNGDDLYKKVLTEYGREAAGGASRHLTFIFTMFVLFQIFNMICSRKIHDEFNIFEGIHTNWMFIGVWILILVLQVLIT